MRTPPRQKECTMKGSKKVEAQNSFPTRPFIVLLVCAGIMISASFWVGVLNGTIPITEASKAKHALQQRTEEEATLKARLQAADNLGRKMEYFRVPASDFCYSYILVYVGNERTLSIQGPVDCDNPAVNRGLKNGITTVP